MERLRKTLLVCVLAVAACAPDTQPADVASRTTLPPAMSGAVMPVFHPCAEEPLRGLECALVRAPVDPLDPDGQQLDVAVARLRATGVRQGTLFVNPGGPGASAREAVRYIGSALGDDVREAYDVVGVDGRGAGGTAGLDCGADYDSIFALDPSPDTQAEKDALQNADTAWARSCSTAATIPLARFSTVDAAYDMDMVRAALGEERVSYLGFSYGSELGAVYVSLFPNRVERFVLDGASDPTAGPVEEALAQGVGFEQALSAFFQWCAQSQQCEWGASAADRFDALLERLDAHPASGKTGRPQVGQGVALLAVATGLYSDSSWSALAAALAAAEKGDGVRLLDFYDQYLERRADGSFGRTQDAFRAVNSADNEPLTIAEQKVLLQRAKQQLPRLWPLFSVSEPHLDPWPAVERRARPELVKAPAGRVLLVGATGDPATPLSGTRVLAAKLDAPLLVRNGEGHTSYLFSVCVRAAVDRFIMEGVKPVAGTEC